MAGESLTRDRRPVIDGALERFGRIDTLVNNAGVFISKPFTDYTAADYARVVGRQPDRVLLADPAGHRRDGQPVRRPVVTSRPPSPRSANSGTPAVLAALTKGGLAAATRSLAIEYASLGIRVNAVSPASSRPRCTRRKATTTSAAGFPRSAGSARSATS